VSFGWVGSGSKGKVLRGMPRRVSAGIGSSGMVSTGLQL
jgi:hypothetical protein